MDYYIIFPSGERSQIDVVQAFQYEKDDYALASRRTFLDESDAIEYAIELAKDNNLAYVGDYLDENGDKDKHNYLD